MFPAAALAPILADGQSLCDASPATPRAEVAAASSSLELQRAVESRSGHLDVISCAQTHVCPQHHDRLGLEERGEGLAKKQGEDSEVWMPMELPGTAHSAKPQSRF